MVDVTPLHSFSDNYIWIIRNTSSQSAAATHCVVVDPGDAGVVFDFLERHALQPGAILITHRDFDHISGIQQLVDRYNVAVYGPANDNISLIGIPLKEGDRIDLPHGLGSYHVLDTPGHTAGHIVYYDNEKIFTGDTLFAAGCGRLRQNTPHNMYDSLLKIRTLPRHLKVYCGHEYTVSNLRFALAVEPNNAAISARLRWAQDIRRRHQPTLPSTLEQELATNPFLRCDQASVIAAAERISGEKMASAVDVFAVMRHWKDNF